MRFLEALRIFIDFDVVSKKFTVYVNTKIETNPKTAVFETLPQFITDKGKKWKKIMFLTEKPLYLPLNYLTAAPLFLFS
jgi:hypothetical protein